VSPGFDLRLIEGRLRELQIQHPATLTNFATTAKELNLMPHEFGLLLETVELRDRDGADVTHLTVWEEGAIKYMEVMRRAVDLGAKNKNNTSFLDGNWSQKLSKRSSILGVGWRAFVNAMAVQEFNAGMGLVSAAPTGGASGTVPGTIVAAAEAVGSSLESQVGAMFVAGIVGRVAFGRGPVSGAQAGCGGEVGVAASMAAGGVVQLLGGGWREIDAAAALAGTPFVGLECSPTRGLVEYPCVPRNGFAALCAIAAAEAACGGIEPPYGADETLDRIFAIGRLLPESLRETNDGDWAAPACRVSGCGNCRTKL
jgi:L-serine dehydratase